MRLRGRQAKESKVRYAYSESATNPPMGRWHISPVLDELKLGGGAPYPICGRVWFGSGWHINRMLEGDPESFERLDAHGDLCEKCAKMWRSMMAEAAVAGDK
jgi:hypothetical protein